MSLYPLSYQKYLVSFLILFSPTTRYGLTCPFPQTFEENPVDGGRNHPSSKNIAHFSQQKIFFTKQQVLCNHPMQNSIIAVVIAVVSFFYFTLYAHIYHANCDLLMVIESYLQHDQRTERSKFFQAKFPLSSPTFILFGKSFFNYCLFSSLIPPFFTSKLYKFLLNPLQL